MIHLNVQMNVVNMCAGVWYCVFLTITVLCVLLLFIVQNIALNTRISINAHFHIAVERYIRRHMHAH